MLTLLSSLKASLAPTLLDYDERPSKPLASTPEPITPSSGRTSSRHTPPPPPPPSPSSAPCPSGGWSEHGNPRIDTSEHAGSRTIDSPSASSKKSTSTTPPPT